MTDCMNTVTDFTKVREAVCVNVRKIMDACRDQDCAENIPVYLTAESQQTLDSATSVKARSAELLYAGVEVEPLQYREGYYCVNTQYYYRIIADAVTRGVRPATVYGLATTCKQAVLYGGTGTAGTFSSDGGADVRQPQGVVEAVDPMVLSARIIQSDEADAAGAAGAEIGELPPAVAEAFDDELVFQDMENQLQVTLGQFSLLRLERQTQLLMPSYDYCMPEKACCDGDCGCPENPCEAFARMQFPVRAFFPAEGDTTLCPCQEEPVCPDSAGERPRSDTAPRRK